MGTFFPSCEVQPQDRLQVGHGKCLHSFEFTEPWFGKAMVPPSTDTKVGGVNDRPGGCATMQTDPGRLENGRLTG